MGEKLRLLREFRESVLRCDGVFTRAMAIEAGIADRILRAGIESGQWRRYQGVFLLAGVPETDRVLLRAALLRAGRRAFATGPSALSLYCLDLNRGNSYATRIGAHTAYLSVPANRHVAIPSVVMLRDKTREQNAQWHDGIPAVSRERAVVDSLRILEHDEALAVLFRTLQLGWVSAVSLAATAARLHGLAGVGQLRELAKEAARGSHAESERLLHTILSRARLAGWEANVPIHDSAGLIGVADITFTSAKLVLEVDGRAWHTDRDRFQRDRTRQNRLVNAGWRVLRYTWEDLTTRPTHVAQTVRTALGRGNAT